MGKEIVRELDCVREGATWKGLDISRPSGSLVSIMA